MILTAFFEGDRLRSLPTDLLTWRIVLERVARSLEWGHVYVEPELDVSLKALHEDTASLRRALVDSGIVMREQGRYWLTRPRDPEEEMEW